MNERSSSDIRSGRLTSERSSSSSSHRHVSIDSTRSNLPLKKLKPELWHRFFDGKKQQESIVKENERKTNTIFNDDYIRLLNEHSLSNEKSPNSSFLPPSIRVHIDHLYKQINDLTLQLSEQQLENKRTQIKTRKLLSNQLHDREKQLKGLLQRRMVDHEKKFKEHEKQYFNLLNEEQMRSLQREERLRDELTFLKDSFHLYKINLEKETADKYQTKRMKEDKMDKQTRNHPSKRQN